MSKQSNQQLPATYEVSQRVILYNPTDKKFLLLKNSEDDVEAPGVWSFVGGRVDKDEDPVDALRREVKEEIGDVSYIVNGVVDVNIGKRCRIGYLAQYQEGEIQLSGEHNDFAWVSGEDIQKGDYHPLVKQFIKAAESRMIEQGYLTDLKRLQADFDNYKKRQEVQQKELGGYLIEKLVLDIIPVLDNFRSATMHVPPEQKDSPWVVGIQYIEKQLETVLVDNGVTPIDAEPGEAFDPNLHEAVGTEEGGEAEGSESVEEKGHKIAKVLQKGYKVGAKVVRAARVNVS